MRPCGRYPTGEVLFEVEALAVGCFLTVDIDSVIVGLAHRAPVNLECAVGEVCHLFEEGIGNVVVVRGINFEIVNDEVTKGMELDESVVIGGIITKCHSTPVSTHTWLGEIEIAIGVTADVGRLGSTDTSYHRLYIER